MQTCLQMTHQNACLQDLQLNAYFVDAELPASSHLLQGLSRVSGHSLNAMGGTFMAEFG